jgi:hypothetical protein
MGGGKLWAMGSKPEVWTVALRRRPKYYVFDCLLAASSKRGYSLTHSLYSPVIIPTVFATNTNSPRVSQHNYIKRRIY